MIRVPRSRITRRRFLIGASLSTPFLAAADALAFEPQWFKTREIRLVKDPKHRVVHFTDLHHKGDRKYLERIIGRINEVSPDFVCFTGDLIEEGTYLDEALNYLSQIRVPLYGVPGNHDYWAKTPFPKHLEIFAHTGGAWLLDRTVVTNDGKFSISGAANLKFKVQPLKAAPDTRHILLMHYPAWVKKLEEHRFDLILAGHSHGGQVRIPFYGAPILPFGVDEYDLGLFRTKAGPLYVGAGLGWFPVPVRFNCRPEITVFEI